MNQAGSMNQAGREKSPVKAARPRHRLDAAGQSVGRLATEIAVLLRGKDRADFSPHLDKGGVVEVVNCDQLKFTGKKLEQKEYFHFSGYIGGLKRKKMAEVYAQNPAAVLCRAVKQMLPPTKWRPAQLKRLIIK